MHLTLCLCIYFAIHTYLPPFYFTRVVTGLLSGKWMEDVSRRDNFKEFIYALLGGIIGGNKQEIENQMHNGQFGGMISADKCSWMSIAFNGNNVTLVGEILKNTSILPLPYNFILAPNTDASTPLPWTQLRDFMKVDISSRTEGPSLIIDGKDQKTNSLVMSIELSASEENPNELVEKWVHPPTQTEAKCIFYKVSRIPNGYTWCKE